jgi:hypothetical protein
LRAGGSFQKNEESVTMPVPHVFRYYRPPENIRRFGRKLDAGRFHRVTDAFAHVQNQLNEGEILIGLYENEVQAYLVGAHISSVERMEEIEDVWGVLRELYAVSLQELDDRIGKGEMDGSD